MLCSLFIVIFGLSICLTPIDAYAQKSKKNNQKKQVERSAPPYAHIVVDAETGKVISQSDADRTLYPASLTKIMTLLLVFEALDAKKVTLRSPVLFSTNAANMPPSKIGLKAKQSISIDNAIKSLVTKSANDVSVALAEKIGGSESRFAQMMNLRARQIGMTQTHFVNASGLHNPRQISSARDMAKLAMYAMKNYPHYYHYFSLKEFAFNGKVHKNHNHLMKTYRGMDGMKTGYIAASGFNLVATAKQGNTRLIGVVFGGRSANTRNTQMANILDAAFSKRTLNVENRSIRPIQPQQTSKQPILTLAPPSAPPKPFSEGTEYSQSLLKKLPPSQTATQTPQFQTLSMADSWSIQIGAFQDRVSTDQALYRALKSLPAPLNRGNAVIIPLRTAEATWVFRARIAGYTQDQAIQACRYLDDCLTVSPHTN